MNRILIFSILLILVGCKTQIPSYSMAIKYCEENKETIELVNPINNDTIRSERMIESCIEGFQLPKFELETIDGNKVSSESLRGKISIINFWFENCPPCVAEIPGFNIIKEKFGSDNVNYIAISTDTKDDVKEFINKTPFNFIHIPNGEDAYRHVFLSKWGFPFTIVSNRNNQILKAFSGGRTDSTAIDEILKKIEPILKKELAYR